MKALFIGRNLIKVDKTDSTSSFLARLNSEKPLLEGALVITGNQEQGRGQRGSVWESTPNKNITLSILLLPAFLEPDKQFQLNKAVSIGVMGFIVAMLSKYNSYPQIKIKWPNDIYVDHKKVAGILIENTLNANKFQNSIIGIGINVNQETFSNSLINPTSLKIVSGTDYHLDDCVAELCVYIEKRYLELRSGKISEIDNVYQESLYQINEWRKYKYKGVFMEAKIIGVSKVGKLLLDTDKNETIECDLKEIEYC